MKKFKEGNCVRLEVDDYTCGVKKGDIGTIFHSYEEPKMFYEVVFAEIQLTLDEYELSLAEEERRSYI